MRKMFCFLRVDHQEAMPRIQYLWEVFTVFFFPLRETRSLFLEQDGGMKEQIL